MDVVCNILWNVQPADITTIISSPEFRPYIELCFDPKFEVPTIVPWSVVKRYPLILGNNVVVDLPREPYEEIPEIHKRFRFLRYVDLVYRHPATRNTMSRILESIVAIPERTNSYRLLLPREGGYLWSMIDPSDDKEDKIHMSTQSTLPTLPKRTVKKAFEIYSLGGGVSANYTFIDVLEGEGWNLSPVIPRKKWSILPLEERTRSGRSSGRRTKRKTSMISPLAYVFFYGAELGLVDPSKPPGPKNHRLKDSLRLFHTTAVGENLHLLLSIFMAIVLVKEKSGLNTGWADFAEKLWLPIFGRYQATVEEAIFSETTPKVPAYVIPYYNSMLAWGGDSSVEWLRMSMNTLAPWADVFPFSMPTDRILYAAQEMVLEETQTLLVPRKYGEESFERSVDEDSKLILGAYSAYANAAASGTQIYMEGTQ